MSAVINDTLAVGLVKQGARNLSSHFAGKSCITLPGTESSSRARCYRSVTDHMTRFLRPFANEEWGNGKHRVWRGFFADITKDDLDLGIGVVTVPYRDPFDYQILHLAAFATRHCHQRLIQTLHSPDTRRLGSVLFAHYVGLATAGNDGESTYRTFRQDREVLIWQGWRAVTAIGVDRLDKHQCDYDRLLAGKPVQNAILIPAGSGT